MTRTIRGSVLAAAVCAAAFHGPVGGAARAEDTTARPRLLILLVVDQFRADYIERYGAHWSGGLKRLVQEGASFPRAAYPYLSTVTCTGHATLSTGRVPRSHGMVMNGWFDRERGETVECTDDPKVSAITADGTVYGGHSLWQLRGDTLADRIGEAGGKVVSLSLKPRSALLPGGRRPTASIWFGGNGTFLTSTALARALPAFAAETLKSRPIEADRGTTWTKLLPAEAYVGADEAVGERPPAGWTSTFPHPIDGPAFFPLWQSSPLSDEYLARLAVAAIDAERLGQDDAPDFLTVSFSALDIVGHAFGPNSHEVQDVLARLDRTIGTLLARLDERVGRGRYVVVLTGDHGVAPIPEQSQAQGLDAGRLAPKSIASDVDAALQRVLGPGTYVAAVLYTDLYFRPGVLEALLQKPEAMRAVKDAILKAPGIAAVYDASELRKVRADDPVQRAAAQGWFKGRSGDLIMVPKRWWIASAAATTHGTHHDYDQRVPIVFFGADIKGGPVDAAATPVDVAPTLARLARVKLRTDGTPLDLPRTPPPQ